MRGHLEWTEALPAAAWHRLELGGARIIDDLGDAQLLELDLPPGHPEMFVRLVIEVDPATVQ